MYGEAQSSAVGDNMYQNWGAMFGFELATIDSNGVVTEAFDAARYGVVGFRVSLTHIMGRSVHVRALQVNDPSVADSSNNFEQNSFVWGGSVPKVVSTASEVTVLFDELTQPAWTLVLDGVGNPAEGLALDATQLHSLIFEVFNSPDDSLNAYSVCVSDLAWIDADGAVVDIP
jgi:hypothetical protein